MMSLLKREIQPCKNYKRHVESRPNVVILLLKVSGKNILAHLIKKQVLKIMSYTPFVDSLAQHSLIFTNAFANGRQSIHGMSSVLAGIPSLTDAFTSRRHILIKKFSRCFCR